VARDDGIWRRLIRATFHPQSVVRLMPGSSGWREEYRRLATRVPCSLAWQVQDHPEGAAHVTFSSDGSLRATCGQDARLLVWRVGPEDKLVLEEDLWQRFGWTAATRVQFGPSGQLVMVSGVLKRNIMRSKMGEIVVFQLTGEDEGDVMSRITLK
jgi:hypothetical protein